MDPPAADAESTKTKNRPQQSCIKCRERKVKCDRAKPCRACVVRGWQDECEYVRTNEDREQINQADEIDSLRKELIRLKRRWDDVQQSSASTRTSSTSSPTDAVAMAMAPQAQGDEPAWPRKAQKRPGDGAAFFLGAQSQQAGFVADAGSYQNAGLNHTAAFEYTQGQPAGSSMLQHPPSTKPGSGESFSGQGPGYDFGSTYSWGFSGVPANAPALYTQQDHNNTSPPTRNNSTAFAENAQHQLQQHPQANFWRGKGVLMQNIYKIIRDCDEAWVPSIIGIVRGSQSPEDAIRSIHRLMSISRSPTESSASAVSNQSSPEAGHQMN